MNTNVELKETITLDEYKAWLTGLLRGKANQLPDLNDWKAIKKMTDKIVPDMVEVQNPSVPSFPTIPYTPVTDEWAPWHQNQPTSTNDIEYLNGIEITNANSTIKFANTGAISINGHGLTTITSTGGDTNIIPQAADYGCYGGSHANSYAPPITAGYGGPVIDEDNEVDAQFILNEIRKRSECATTANTSPRSDKMNDRVAKLKKRLQR